MGGEGEFGFVAEAKAVAGRRAAQGGDDRPDFPRKTDPQTVFGTRNRALHETEVLFSLRPC